MFALCAFGALAIAACSRNPSPQDATQLAALQSKIAALEQRKTRVQDSNDIKRLQAAYGYYIDRGLWDQAADLFADDGTIEMARDGVYVGKARVRAYLYALGGGREGFGEGKLDEHMEIMPAVTVAADGRSAKARWRAVVLAGEYGKNAFWGEGPYENEYVKQDGVWKIAKLHWYQSLYVPYEGGWQTQPDPTGGKLVSDTLPPDRPPSVAYETWPGTFVPPYDFPNPVAKYVPLAEAAP